MRGEKNWQAWAGDMEEFGDMQTDSANIRIPYHSTLQLADDVNQNL